MYPIFLIITGISPFFPAGVFYSGAGRIEAWGRGIETIGDECVQYGLSLPRYTIHTTDIMVRFPTLFVDETKQTEECTDAKIGTNSPKIGTNSPKIDTNFDLNFKQLPNSQQQVLLAIQKDGSITQRKIAEKTGLALSTVNSHIDQLQKKGFLSRTGTNRKGYWILLNQGEDESPKEYQK